MISDRIAAFLADHDVRHVFTVSGAGNIRILNAIAKLGATKIISTHHEQAAAMAAIGYYRASGRVAPVVVTMGGGAANVITGVVSSWMDSIPLLVFAGTEDHYHTVGLRAHGVQSFDLGGCVKPVVVGTASLCNDNFAQTMSGYWKLMLSGRPGPVVLEVPVKEQ